VGCVEHQWQNQRAKHDLGLRFFAPSKALAPYIQCYWRIKRTTPLKTLSLQKIVTDGGSGMLFNFGAPLYSFHNNQAIKNHEPLLFMPPRDQALFLGFKGVVDAFGVRFLAGGAYPFFRDMIQSNHLLIPLLDDAFNPLKKALTQPAMIEHVEESLKAKLKPSPHHHWIREVIARIKAHEGTLKADALAEYTALSKRHFERRFKQEVGLSPKQFSRIIRIQNARTLMQKKAPNTSLTDVSYACHFFDQAHFIRDFKWFTHETPKAYVERKRRMSYLYNF